MDIKQILQSYDKDNITIAVLGSHSALDVCRGAKDLGFKTLVITQKGRGLPYSKYYKTQSHSERSEESVKSKMDPSTSLRMTNELGCVDEIIELVNFKDILKPEVQAELVKRNSIFVPHRSFEVYINDYDAIENSFNVPMFGNRKLLRSEERGSGNGVDQYEIMDEAGIRYPKQFAKPEDIDRLVIVKVLEKERGFERAFFIVDSYDSYLLNRRKMIENGDATEEAFNGAVIEEYLVGVQVNFNFFYDPLDERLELLGTDTRRQTNAEGYSRVPYFEQEKVGDKLKIKYEEAGHIAVTVLESLLEPAFEIGEKFVEGCKKVGMPVVGPFGLQTMIIPGPPKKEIIVFDVSPRMPGSPGIKATPYSGYLFGKSVSAGERVAMQIKDALDKNRLDSVLS